MKLHIESSAIWFPDCENGTALNAVLSNETELNLSWPKLAFVPAMQRRRLSPFAKISLYVANQASDSQIQDLPMIFSSRHGDLHKTSDLLGELALDNELSPTAFSLSVHNAVAGLYSILTKNKSAINAMAAGKDSFFMALIDAYARLKSGVCDKLLLVHADLALPQAYDVFKDEKQIDHAVALVLSLSGKSNANINIEFEAGDQNLNSDSQMPLALQFAAWLDSKECDIAFTSDRYKWHCSKDV